MSVDSVSVASTVLNRHKLVLGAVQMMLELGEH
jgi:hypothetical protein